MDLDIQKNAGGNASAGVRARRGLRLLKKEAAALIKSMVEIEKNRKAAE
jgi:urease gamma subunit